MGGSIVITA